MPRTHTRTMVVWGRLLLTDYPAPIRTVRDRGVREWDADAVTVLATAEVDSAKDVWYDVAVEWRGSTFTVSRGPQGGTLTDLFAGTTLTTNLTNASEDIGFGVGEEADYRCPILWTR